MRFSTYTEHVLRLSTKNIGTPQLKIRLAGLKLIKLKEVSYLIVFDFPLNLFH